MADDLKSVLRSVISSRGSKKFFFCYGAGKRKDGKGDGELLVRGRKPKKTEIEAAVPGCRDVVEGICWSGKGPDAEGTVYFQGNGKKLSSMLVAKMALAAKRSAGQQFDFQIPSPASEEEAKKLESEEPEEEELSADDLKELKANLKRLQEQEKELVAENPARKSKLDPLSKSAASLVEKKSPDAVEALQKFEAALDAAAKEGGGGDASDKEAASAFQQRVDKLAAAVKQAAASGSDAGAEAKLRFSEAQTFGRKKEFEKGMELLDVVEEQIKLAKAARSDGGGDSNAAEAAYQERAEKLLPEVKKVAAAGGPGAEEAKLRFSESQMTARKKDFVQANALLDEVEGHVKRAKAAAAKATADEKAFATRSKAVAEDVKRALAEGGDLAETAKLRFSEAQTYARKKEFDQARALLDEVEQLVAKALSRGAESEAEESDAEESEADEREDAEGDADEAADERKADEAAYKSRVDKLLPELKKIMAGGGPAAEEAKLRFSESQTFARKKDFAQAGALLDDVEGHMKRAAAAAAKPSPEERAFETRSKAVLEDVKRAVATGSMLGNTAKLRFSEAQTIGRKKDFPEARRLLDEVEELVRQALAAGPANGPSPEQKQAETAYKSRVDRMMPGLKKVVAGGGPAAEEAKLRYSEAQVFARKKEYDQAMSLLDQVDFQVRRAEAAAAAVSPEEKAFVARSQAVAEVVKRAVADGFDLGEDAKLRFSEAQVFGRKKDFAPARDLLDQVEELVTQTRAAGPPPGAEQKKAESAYRARVDKLMPDLKRIVAAGGPASNEAKLRYSEAQVFARKKDYAQAAALLDDVEGHMRRADAAAGRPSPEEKALATRGRAVAEDLKRAVATGTPAGEEAKLRFSEAQVFARKKDFAQARVLLDQVEELVAQALAPQSSTQEESESSESETEEPEASPQARPSAEERGFTTRSNAVGEDVKRAAATGTPAGEEAKLRFSEAQVFGRKKDFAQARVLLDQVEELVAEALAPQSSTQEESETAESETEEPEASPQARPSAEERGFTTRSNAVGEDVKRAAATGTPAGEEAKLRFSEAQVFGRKKDFAQARVLLDQVEELVAQALASQTSTQEESESSESETEEPEASPQARPSAEERGFTTRSSAVGEDVKRAVATGTPAGEEAKLRFSEAQVFGRKKDFAQARVLLDQVEELVAQALASQSSTQEESETAESETEEPETQAKPTAEERAFATRSQAVGVDVQRAAAGGTAAGSEAKLRFSEAQTFGRMKDFAQARALLDQVEELVAQALAESSATPQEEAEVEAEGEEADAGEPQRSAEERGFATRSQAVGVDVQRAAATGTPAGEEAKLRFSEAQVFGRKKDFAQARVLLDQVEELVAQALAVGGTQANPNPNPQGDPNAGAYQDPNAGAYQDPNAGAQANPNPQNDPNAGAYQDPNA